MIWEGFENRSRKNFVFYEEPRNVFSLTAVLQMGRDYRDNKDGFVYVYSPNGSTEGTANELVMFRVPKTRILDRTAELDRLTNDQSPRPQLSYSDEIAHSQMPRGHGHPRNVRILPKSRDFH